MRLWISTGCADCTVQPCRCPMVYHESLTLPGPLEKRFARAGTSLRSSDLGLPSKRRVVRILNG